jgi:hypothetical protein
MTVRAPGWRGKLPGWLGAQSLPSRAVTLRVMNDLVAASRLPVEEQLAAARRIVDAHPSEDLHTVFIVNDFPSKAQLQVEYQAALRCALAGLAAERYRQEQGAWPVSLEAMAQQDYLRKVPLDPYDSQPLRFRRLPDGVVIYSVGVDGVDHGGIVNRANRTNGLRTEEGFQLWDPESRQVRVR